MPRGNANHVDILSAATAWLLAALAGGLLGCDKASPPKDGFASPHEALQCQLAGHTERDVDAIRKCFHPRARPEVGAHLTKRLDDWGQRTDELSILAEIKPGDFKLEPTPQEGKEWGDEMASYRLPDDEFVAMRYQGRWYVVDSGL